MSCDVGEATEGVGGGSSAHSPTLPSLHHRRSSFSSLANPSVASSTSQAHYPTLPSLHLRLNFFSNSSVASPTSQLILQPLRPFTYVTAHSRIFYRLTYVIGTSLTSTGEPPVVSPVLRGQFLLNYKLNNFVHSKNTISEHMAISKENICQVL